MTYNREGYQLEKSLGDLASFNTELLKACDFDFRFAFCQYVL